MPRWSEMAEGVWGFGVYSLGIRGLGPGFKNTAAELT